MNDLGPGERASTWWLFRHAPTATNDSIADVYCIAAPAPKQPSFEMRNSHRGHSLAR